MPITTKVGKGAGPQGQALRIIRVEQRTDFDVSLMRPDTKIWRLVAVWTTLNGSWEPSVNPSSPFTIDQWARDEFLRAPNDPYYNDGGGGDHHIFAMCQNSDAVPYRGAGFLFTSDGPQWLQPGSNTSHVIMMTAKQHGWADLAMYNSLSRPPEPGPWSVTKYGISDILTGVGMPWNYHVSTFAVWQGMTWAEAGQPDYPTLEAQLLGEAEKRQVIQFNPQAALQKAIFAAGFVPNSGEFETVRESVRIIAQRAESLSSGEVRVYYAPVGDWANVKYVVRPA